MSRGGMVRRAQAAAVWTLGHLARLWTLAVAAVILAVSWHALRQIHIGAFRAALHGLDARWLGIAAAATILNVAVMGCYDVFAFRHTTARALERWRFGAVAFAWSNFLTLGPLAGPAIRFWLYRPAVERTADLRAGVLSVTVAFASGLVGWTAAALAFSAYGMPLVAAGAAVATIAAASIGSAIGRRLQPFGGSASGARQIVAYAAIGWADWLLGAVAFVACVRATGQFVPLTIAIRDFFVGQLVGLASLIPGGFGTSDAFWLARMPLPHSVTAAALMAYRVIYYVGPWAVASLVLLGWAMRRSPERVTVARRSLGGLVAGAGILIMLSSASPALHARLILLERFVPLPLVEVGQLAAALAGLFVLVLARGLSRGYRTAFRATVALLLLAAGASILKGLDWEESVVLGSVAIAAASQAAIFTRDSRGDWLEGTDLGVACAALAMFLAFGVVSHHVGARAFHRAASFGYRLQSQRFVRTAASMAFAIGAAALYILVRPRVEFQPPTEGDIEDVLDFNGRHGEGTTPLMVANGDKAVFRAGELGCALYRTIGPYLAVFSDPVVRSPADRAELLESLLVFAADLDRRVLFYQISVDWVPLLHDRGYHFFKLGEEAHVPLDRVTTDGHEGKAVRQVLRRAERDGVRFRILAPYQIDAVLPQLRAISDDWLRTKGVAERQFSIGSFSDEYLRRFRCAVVESVDEGRILAFANLLEGPRRQELSVDLMRSRSDGPRVMDFLITSLLLEGKRLGYQRFNLGMAPLASVGEQRGAYVRERLARLMFQRGEHWYNFQGVRFYKEKFNPEWVPRYLAYPRAFEWAAATAAASALVAGGWGSALRPARERHVGVEEPAGAEA